MNKLFLVILLSLATQFSHADILVPESFAPLSSVSDVKIENQSLDLHVDARILSYIQAQGGKIQVARMTLNGTEVISPDRVDLATGVVSLTIAKKGQYVAVSILLERSSLKTVLRTRLIFTTPT